MTAGTRMTSSKGKTYIVANDGLQILLHIFGFSRDSGPEEQCDGITDPILVAIDFENTYEFHKGLTPDSDFQVGLAILDTRDLLRRRQSIPPSKIISSFNFVCGSSEYQRKACQNFLFGIPLKIQQSDMLTNINSSILQGHDNDDEQREIVLVGHAITNELRILSGLGFDFQRVSACLDTFKICAQVLPYFALKLGELLDELQCPYKRLHNGGNDANFTLRSLLLLTATYVCSQKKHYHSEEGMLDYLEAIGYSSLPVRPPGKSSSIL